MSRQSEKKIPSSVIFLFLALLLVSAVPLEAQRHNPEKYNVYSSDTKQFVWIRVFKVASGSIRDVLRGDVSDMTQSHPKRLPEKYDNYFKFSFVRNPWDRILSCYFHKILTKKAQDFRKCFDKDFEFFVDYISRLDVANANPHIKLQTRLIPVEECDFIGKMENFSEDFKYVCDVIGVKYNVVPHKHKTDHAHYSTYYTPRTRQIIAEKYKEDIKAFGFTFETE